MKPHTFHPGGVHPPQNKLTAGSPIQPLELPMRVSLLMSQHIGSPAKPVVTKGQIVGRGEKVGEATSMVSANVHTPISGTVKGVERVRNAFGQPCDAVVVEATEAQHLADLEAIASRQPLTTLEQALGADPADLVRIIGEAGIVGLGGATFPTRVKLSPPPGMSADTLLINGAECEPYLTNDDAIMRANAPAIVAGVRLLARAARVSRVVIGIETNKPEAIDAMRKACEGIDSIEVMPLQVKYPEGSEKQLIQAATGRVVASGALPISTGVIVQNVATALAVERAVIWGEPLMERVVTVTGPNAAGRGNFSVAIGSDIEALIARAGGLPDNTGKVILGGPMMGRTANTLSAPTTKGVSGVLMLPQDQSKRRPVDPCIRCARCVDGCPMGLEPYLLAALGEQSRWDEAEDEKVMNCVECGSCSYICPSSRPLLDYIRVAKIKVGANIRSRKSQQQ